MRVWAASVVVWVCVVVGCEDEAPARPTISKAPPAQPASGPKPATPPPDVRLAILEERLSIGLSIQNRSGTPQQLASSVRLLGGTEARELALVEGVPCITLLPGGEWLWPPDWGQTLAPDQSALATLAGMFRFEVRACEGEGVVQSAAFALPAGDDTPYGEGASAPGK